MHYTQLQHVSASRCDAALFRDENIIVWEYITNCHHCETSHFISARMVSLIWPSLYYILRVEPISNPAWTMIFLPTSIQPRSHQRNSAMLMNMALSIVVVWTSCVFELTSGRKRLSHYQNPTWFSDIMGSIRSALEPHQWLIFKAYVIKVTKLPPPVIVVAQGALGKTFTLSKLYRIVAVLEEYMDTQSFLRRRPGFFRRLYQSFRCCSSNSHQKLHEQEQSEVLARLTQLFDLA